MPPVSMGFIILGLSVWACVLTRSQLTPIISNIFNLTLWVSPWVRSGAALMRLGIFRSRLVSKADWCAARDLCGMHSNLRDSWIQRSHFSKAALGVCLSGTASSVVLV